MTMWSPLTSLLLCARAARYRPLTGTAAFVIRVCICVSMSLYTVWTYCMLCLLCLCSVCKMWFISHLSLSLSLSLSCPLPPYLSLPLSPSSSPSLLPPSPSAEEYKDSQEWFVTRNVQDVRVVSYSCKSNSLRYSLTMHVQIYTCSTITNNMKYHGYLIPHAVISLQISQLIPPKFLKWFRACDVSCYMYLSLFVA